MRLCGIIAEYDPFHNGHAWHMQEARRAAQADLIVCVMSCHFTQRGMPALLSPHCRAEMALAAGADLVLGLPLSFSLCAGERFAAGGIAILKALGAQALSFGIEAEGLSCYADAAALLEAPTPAFQALLRDGLQKGRSFPRAQGEALSAALKLSPAALAQPNTALAICYARANAQLQAGLTLYPIVRRGDYRSASFPAQPDAFPSASAVRASLLQGDWAAVQSAVPAHTLTLLQNVFSQRLFHPPEALNSLLRWRLRDADSLTRLPDLSEGLEHLLPRAVDGQTRDDMILRLKSKRYSYARLSRLLSHVLLGTDRQQLSAAPSYAYVLGFRRSASPLLRRARDLRLLPALPSERQTPEMLLDARAADLWSLGAGLFFGSLYRQKPVIYDDKGQKADVL